MPKRGSKYKEEKRREIIGEAMNLFSEKGYHGTKMVDIAKGVGLSKGAVYQYFGSKDILFNAVLEHRILHRQEEIFSFLDSEDLHIISSVKFYNKMLSLRSGPSRFGVELLSEITREDSSLKNIMKERSEIALTRFTDFIEGFKRKGDIREDIDSRSFAIGIIALHDGLSVELMFGLDIEDARKTWVTITRLMLNRALRLREN